MTILNDYFDKKYKENLINWPGKPLRNLRLRIVKPDYDYIEEIKEDIISELLNESKVHIYDKGEGLTDSFLALKEDYIYVEREELDDIRTSLRPELSSNLIIADTNIPSYIHLLNLLEWCETRGSNFYDTFKKELYKSPVDPISYEFLKFYSENYIFSEFYAKMNKYFHFPKTQILEVPRSLLNLGIIDINPDDLTENTKEIIDAYLREVFLFKDGEVYNIRTSLSSPREKIVINFNLATNFLKAIKAHKENLSNEWIVEEEIPNKGDGLIKVDDINTYSQYIVDIDVDKETIKVGNSWKEKKAYRSVDPSKIGKIFKEDNEYIKGVLKHLIKDLKIKGKYELSILVSGSEYYITAIKKKKDTTEEISELRKIDTNKIMKDYLTECDFSYII